jgi:hypothetical protein
MKDNLIKILIPLVAVLIIFESIILVSSLKKNKVVTDNQAEIMKAKEVAALPVVDLKFVSDVNEMKVGKSYKVTLNLTPKQEIALNALDLYVKYDPTILTISNLVSSKDVAKPNFIKVSDKKSVIVANFLFAAKDGVVFAAKEANLLTFSVTPKKAGVSSIEISTGDNEGSSVTMFVDKVTSKGLPFSSNKLEIKLVN